uniref:Uncharacterized protein n=1 Tax=Arundo donax TaxID=35708 RepID=A0A0A8Y9Z0_ARUDO
MLWSQPLSFPADLFATCWSDSPKNLGVGLHNYFLALSVDQLSTKWFNCFWCSILQFDDLHTHRPQLPPLPQLCSAIFS